MYYFFKEMFCCLFKFFKLYVILMQMCYKSGGNQMKA